MGILKKAGADIVLRPIRDGVFAGSKIAEVFDTAGRTRMACGVHEIIRADVVVEKAPVDDVLYILEGEMEIEAGGVVQTCRAGDFVYLRAGVRQRFIVRDRVKHVYVCYPSDWKDGAQA